jgi:hypothetical protein
MPPKPKQSSNRCPPKEKELNRKTVPELRSLAKSHGIKGYGGMTKSNLVSFLCPRLTMEQIKGGTMEGGINGIIENPQSHPSLVIQMAQCNYMHPFVNAYLHYSDKKEFVQLLLDLILEINGFSDKGHYYYDEESLSAFNRGISNHEYQLKNPPPPLGDTPHRIFYSDKFFSMLSGCKQLTN